MKFVSHDTSINMSETTTNTSTSGFDPQAFLFMFYQFPLMFSYCCVRPRPFFCHFERLRYNFPNGSYEHRSFGMWF
jgi:hypothetical protein